MNRMYYWVRHVYDASRKYYLLGRDELIGGLDAKPGEHICEVGSGTARNLIKMAKKYTDAHFYGLDISDEMLKTARHSLKKNGMEKRIQVIQADACSFDAQKDFGLEQKFDKIIFSYTLSLMPFWQVSIDHALTQLKKGGTLHIVDFASPKSHPLLIRKLMAPWLTIFHIFFETGIEDYLKNQEAQALGNLKNLTRIKERACIAVFQKN